MRSATIRVAILGQNISDGPGCSSQYRWSTIVNTTAGGHSNQDQICLVQILEYIGFSVYGGS